MSFTRKYTLPIVFLTVFVDLIGIGIIIPVFPQLLANPSSPFSLLSGGITEQTGLIILGALAATYPLMQFFSAPILGQLSDKFGRKRILLISLAGTCVSYLLFALAILLRNIPLLFVSRCLDGITGGNISVAQAAIADVSIPENRAKNFGLIGAAVGLGFIIGPYIGGKLSDPSVVSWFNAATPFWFSAALSLCNFLFVVFRFPETHEKRNMQLAVRWHQAFTNILRAFSFEKLRTLFVTSFLYSMGFSFCVGFFAVFLVHRFGFTQGNVGDYFAFVGICIALTQMFLIRVLHNKFAERQVLMFSMFGTAIVSLLYLLPHNWLWLLVITPLFAAMNGLTYANTSGLISRSTDPEHQGLVLGIVASLQALAGAIPSLLSGVLAASFGVASPIVVASILMISAGILFISTYRPFAAKAA